ncbi:hypothetical protein [Xanthomonas sp. 60]
MNAPIRHLRVAESGLDLLHRTRLKLACTLLLSERMEVTLIAWDGTGVDLLVTGQETPDLAAHREVPVLRIARDVAVAAAGRLPHGATVRDINQQLSALLASTPEHLPDAGASSAAPVLLQRLAEADPRVIHLLQRGSMMLALEGRTRSLWLPPGMTLAELLPLLDDPAWSSSELDDDTFQHQYSYRLPHCRSYEALYFQVARQRPALLPRAPDEATSVQLRRWPDLDGEGVPADWLPAIAQLHARPWRATALARACHLPHDSVQFLFSAAAASGLASYLETAVPPSARPAGNRDSRFLSWVARRFGLLLGDRA